MALQTVQSDLRVSGHFSSTSMTLPSSAVTNASVAADAAIEATKIEHQHVRGHAQPNSAATTETRTVHVAKGGGTLENVEAGSIVKAVGDSIVTVDVKKNGTTVLSSVITLDSGNTNRVAEAGTISVPTYVAGDWLETVITATIGTGTLPTGVYVEVTLREAAV